MTPGRTRARSYLLLARVSNLPTVWTNVLAGLCVAGAALHDAWWLAGAVSLFYMGGMFLNDAFDAAFDARMRPDRPIPRGDVSRREAFAAGALLMLGGEVALAFSPHPADALTAGAALGAAIVAYDYSHKGRWYGPYVMGLCRMLVYVVAAAATADVTAAVAAAGMALGVYVVGLSFVARRVGPRAATVMPWLLAGISLVDGAIMLGCGQVWTLAAAGTAFAATRALQRVVPGT